METYWISLIETPHFSTHMTLFGVRDFLIKKLEKLVETQHFFSHCFNHLFHQSSKSRHFWGSCDGKKQLYDANISGFKEFCQKSQVSFKNVSCNVRNQDFSEDSAKNDFRTSWLLTPAVLWQHYIYPSLIFY